MAGVLASARGSSTAADSTPLRALGTGAVAWLVPALLLVLWAIGSSLHWISLQTLPAPGRVGLALWQLLTTGSGWQQIAISLQRVFGGFVLGAGAGLVLGVAMGLSRMVRELLDPSFRVLASVPLLGWLPLLMLLLGIGEPLKLVLIAKAALVPVTLNTSRGIAGVARSQREVAQLYGFNAVQQLWHVLLPAALPSIWTGLRYGLTSCWLVLVLVELLAASEGLGYLMSNGQQLMQMDVLLAAVAVVGAIGFGLDRGLEAIERHLLRWRGEAFA